MTIQEETFMDRIIPERIDLPSEGGWVEFWDAEDLTGADHRRALDHVRGDPGEPRVAMATDLLYSYACILIRAWHIPYTPKGTDYVPGTFPIPDKDASLLERLRLTDYSAIMMTISPAMRLLTGVGVTVTPDDAGVPGTPTSPSGG
jgi:hypothetical protein